MASAPAIHHFLFGDSFFSDPTASDPPARPNENSESITGMPSRNTQPIYISKNAAPPLLCASDGKRHTLPRPTAEPTVAAISPIFELN